MIAAAAQGDRAAFAVFVERHQASVYRFAASVCGEAHVAEDVLQDTFIAAWRGAATFRGDARASSWLLTIARNACNRTRRRRQGEPDSLESLDCLARDAGWGGGDGGRMAERIADRDQLARGLGQLSAKDREILLLVDVEGLSGAEASEALGIGVAAVKSRLHRARLRLLARLRDQEQAGGGA